MSEPGNVDLRDMFDPGDDGNETWTLNLFVKPGAAPEVCDKIRALDGVAELYRAYRPGRRS